MRQSVDASARGASESNRCRVWLVAAQSWRTVVVSEIFQRGLGDSGEAGAVGDEQVAEGRCDGIGAVRLATERDRFRLGAAIERSRCPCQVTSGSRPVSSGFTEHQQACAESVAGPALLTVFEGAAIAANAAVPAFVVRACAQARQLHWLHLRLLPLPY